MSPKKFLFVAGLLFCFVSIAQQNNRYTLWYNKPAKDWNEALPIGNGRLGAMIFGRPDAELIQLNEQTLWTGGPVNLNPNPEAVNYLQSVREELFRDSIGKAVRLLRKMQGPDTEMYQPLGDIVIRQTYAGEVSSVYRDLNISTAIASTKITAGGIIYTKELFSSAVDQLIVIKLSANKVKALNFSVDVFHELQFQKMVTAEKELLLKGKARITNDERRNPKPLVYEDANRCNGMRFQFRVKAVAKDGTISNTDSSLIVTNATEVLLFVSAATSFNGINKCPDSEGKDEAKLANEYLQKALAKNYQQIVAAHIACLLYTSDAADE